MAKLILYVPFPRDDSKGGDLRDNAKELASAPTKDFTIRTTPIASIKSVFLGEEENVGNALDEGDFLCVNAHGGTGKYYSVTDNKGSETKIDDLVANLKKLNADQAGACYFFVCFSAEEKHIANVWKKGNPSQKVFGSYGVAQGAIIMQLKTKIKSSIFDFSNGQLKEIDC